MTHTQCNVHLIGSKHMAKVIPLPVTQGDDKYIKTFDTADDPIVYTLVRTSPYTFDDMIIGVFDSKESLMIRLNRIMDRPENDETFKIETHNLRNVEQEEALDL